jgi:hypothetical protein
MADAALDPTPTLQDVHNGVDADVQSAVYDGLLRNRKLDVVYMPRGVNKPKQYELNPLGLVLKDGLFYLVCCTSVFRKRPENIICSTLIVTNRAERYMMA